LPGQAILVLTQLPDRATAAALARILIESRLAACVSIGAPVDSLYHWRGEIETAQEIPIVIKTRAGRYAEVEAAIRAGHPYELPEILAVPVISGFAPYLNWLVEESTASAPSG
jgi:periplasmic divalent cation tolerance protein